MLYSGFQWQNGELVLNSLATQGLECGPDGSKELQIHQSPSSEGVQLEQ